MDSLDINKELFLDIMQYIREKNYAHNTIQTYRFNLKKLLKGNSKLDQELANKYMKKYMQPNHRAILKIINEYCIVKQIDFRIAITSAKQKPRKIPDILSPEEIKIIVKATPKPYNLMLRCIYGIGAGLRISEAIKLCWNNIRWSEWLDKKEYGVVILKETKRDEERVVNIPNEIMEDLYVYAKEKNVLNEFGIPSGGLIFPINVNTYKPELSKTNRAKWKNEYVEYAYQWFNLNVLRKYCDKAINKRVHAHMLRHSRATYLHEVEKMPLERIQDLLGHADINTTMIYTRIDPKSTFGMMKDTKVV